jgi:DNA-directed RNA polymerase subunit RPC12/RpoP
MLQYYKCQTCSRERFVFSDEQSKLNSCPCGHPNFVNFFNRQMIVHGIKSYGSEHYALDSLGTLHELNRILDLEAASLREIRGLNEARRLT